MSEDTEAESQPLVISVHVNEKSASDYLDVAAGGKVGSTSE